MKIFDCLPKICLYFRDSQWRLTISVIAAIFIFLAIFWSVVLDQTFGDNSGTRAYSIRRIHRKKGLDGICKMVYVEHLQHARCCLQENSQSARHSRSNTCVFSTLAHNTASVLLVWKCCVCVVWLVADVSTACGLCVARVSVVLICRQYVGRFVDSISIVNMSLMCRSLDGYCLARMSLLCEAKTFEIKRKIRESHIREHHLKLYFARLF